MSILPPSSIGDESTGFYDGVATQSLRTNRADSNYFYYTPSAGDRMSGSFSIWLKGSDLSGTSYGRYVFQNYGGGSEAQFSFIQINNTGNMAFGGYGVNYFASTAVLRDETNYYNLLWTWDTTNGTQNKRQRGYINGVELTSMGSGTRSGVRQELGYGGNFQHNFLANYYPPGGGSDSYVEGHVAYTCYVNGLTLDPTAFGETKDGVWIPKNYASKPSLIAQDTGTAIGDLTGQGGLAGAFNGTRFQAYSSSAATTGSQATGYIGKNWGSSKTVTGFILYSPTQYGFVGSGGSTFTVKLYGKNGAPSNATDGTLLFTSSSVNDNLISTNGERGAIKYFADTTIASEETISSFTTTTAFTYHWVVITPNTSESVHVSEIEFYEDGNIHFGTGGFRLDFNASDLNTSGSARTDPYGSSTDQPNNSLADASGSGNHLTKTTNVISTDFSKDSPENNFATMLGGLAEPSDYQSYYKGTYSEGNLKVQGSSSGWTNGSSNFGVSSGKWYAECIVNSWVNNQYVRIGLRARPARTYDEYFVLGNGTGQLDAAARNGRLASFSTGDVIQFALDLDNNAFYLGVDNTWGNSATATEIANGTTTNAFASGSEVPTGDGHNYFFYAQPHSTGTSITWNFGQDGSFANTLTGGDIGSETDSNGKGAFKYAPPSGFLALCSSNLPDLTISPGQSTQADDHFNTFLYTGDGTSNKNFALNTFTPDWSWNKGRSQVTQNTLIDSSRVTGTHLDSSAVYPNLHTNTTDAEASDSHPKIITNGIQVSGGLDNNDGTTFVVWTWKANGGTLTTNDASSTGIGTIDSVFQANGTSGFSIVTYTGTGSAGTIRHGLSVAPSMVIIKNRAGGSVPNWVIGQDQSGFTGQMYFDTGAFSTNSGSFNNTAPTTSVVSINTDSTVNQSTKTYVMYCFANVEGYSKIGKYTGNGSSDGTFVYTGFRPAFIMTKRSDSSGNWYINDSARSPFNSTDLFGGNLYADLNNVESGNGMDILSNGFKIRNTDSSQNASGGTYIYMAFAEQPFLFSNAR